MKRSGLMFFPPISILLGALSSFAVASPVPDDQGSAPPKCNILFVILDDVGADQSSLSNPSGTGLAQTPTIDAIAAQGVNFTNCWSMPECSPSRACFFTGRFPSRTGVGSPMTQPTLAQSQCSPFEMTTPRILGNVGYECGLFGKFHISQENYNPFGLLAPSSNGFTNFNGTLLGAPPFIDPTIAGHRPIWPREGDQSRCEYHHAQYYPRFLPQRLQFV